MGLRADPTKDVTGKPSPLDERELRLQERLFSSPETMPETWLSFMLEHQAVNGLEIPRSRIHPYNVVPMRVADAVTASQTTTDTSYTDLSTVGPTLTGLSNGRYFVMLGCSALNSVGGSTFSAMSVALNSDSALGGIASAFTGATFEHSISAFFEVELTRNNNNSITAKYRVSGASTGTFQFRRLSAIKIGT